MQGRETSEGSKDTLQKPPNSLLLEVHLKDWKIFGNGGGGTLISIVSIMKSMQCLRILSLSPNQRLLVEIWGEYRKPPGGVICWSSWWHHMNRRKHMAIYTLLRPTVGVGVTENDNTKTKANGGENAVNAKPKQINFVANWMQRETSGSQRHPWQTAAHTQFIPCN